MDDQIYQHVHKLYLFAQVAELRNFRLVASRVGVTPSAISQNIASLEAYLEKTLLIRHKGQVEVTEAGRKLLAEVRPILADLSELRAVSDSSGPVKDRLKFGAYESIAMTISPGLFVHLSRLNPSVRLDVQTGRSAALATSVRQGSLDFAFVTEGIRESGVSIDTVGSDGLGLYIAEAMAGVVNGWEAVKELGVATFSAGPDGYPLYYQKFLGSLPDKCNLRVTSDSIETIASLTRRGLVVGILPHLMARRETGLVPVILPEVTLNAGTHSWLLLSRKNTAAELKDIMLAATRNAFQRLTQRQSEPGYYRAEEARARPEAASDDDYQIF